MGKQNAIKIFEDKTVRTLWDGAQEKWYISIIDVIEILTGSPRPRKYWNALKTKLRTEGSELSQKVGQLKMQSADGKFYLTDVADTEQLFRHACRSLHQRYFASSKSRILRREQKSSQARRQCSQSSPAGIRGKNGEESSNSIKRPKKSEP